MVFATEFNPREQSQRRPRPQNKSQSNSDLQTHPISPVVPLQVGGPARRVRLDADSTLSLPKQPKLSLGLRVLTRLQQGSTAITGVLVTGALVVYGSTVYVDKSTNKAILQLDTLQGESQQLTSANESIKQSLAEQATRPNSGLEPYEAGDVLFVQPASPRPKLAKENLADSPDSAAPEPAEMPGPLGY
ncbi:MAG: hypothetical protein DCF25_03310 [Leptolyngbya foveolarum]|uniref:Cell division protein FtsL n=1 Tax=Leptolyngbya foveolarum TaxID=47253 RepID=A0A2W4WS94_9CYAN|nr:MAG: hypothetical protein DCF25_03310 [Leptolyngbya foveolarum]